MTDHAHDSTRRLESWKEIAAYLHRTVRTVQRWERTEHLPVHRHHHHAGATVYAFAAELDAWWLGLGRRATPGPIEDGGLDQAVRVVILPYADLTADRSHPHVCHGISEELTVALARGPAIVVTAPSQVRTLLSRLGERAAIRALNGDIVLEGSVRARGTGLRISTRIVRTQDGRVLAAFHLDGTAAQLLALQELLARRVRHHLLLPEPDDSQSARPHSSNVDAYSMYLMSRQMWSLRTPEALRRSVALAERAITLDPHYSLAYCAAASAELALASYVVHPPAAGMRRARAAAARALALGDTNGEPHAVLGAVALMFDWNTDAADAAFRRALARDADDATTWQWHSLVHVATGDLESAVACAARAEHLDPTSGAVKANLAWVLYFAGRFEESLAATDRAIAFDPNFARAYWNAAWSYGQLGRPEEMLHAIETCVALADYPAYRAALCYACARNGEIDRARALLEALRGGTAYVSRYWLAVAELANGEEAAALRSLERAVAAREWFLITARLEPLFDGIRHLRSFQSVLAGVRPASTGNQPAAGDDISPTEASAP